MQNIEARKNVNSARLEQASQDTLEDATISQIAKGIVAILPKSPKTIQDLAMMDEKPAYRANLDVLYRALYAKMGTLSLNRNIKEVVPVMATNHTLVLEKGKETVVSDMKENVIPMVSFGGHLMPQTYPKVIERCVMTALADAAYFPIASRYTGDYSEIDPKVCALVKFPYLSIDAKTMPLGNVLRSDFMQATIDDMVEDWNYALKVYQTRIPPGIMFNFETGMFDFKFPGVLVVNSITRLFELVDMHRRIRGSDKAPRHLELAAYMYGLGSRALYKSMYVLHDIEALGLATGVKMLEITNVDAVVNEHVLHSLVYSGWVIRVSGSNNYPQRIEKKTGGFEQNKGVFSFFPTHERYLRYVPIEDAGFRIASGVVYTAINPHEIILRQFDYFKSETAIPFCRVFLNDDMIEFEKNYPDCSLFPTMHAHNGHVLVVRARVVDKNKPFSLEVYINRVALATTYKTFYIYLRRRFWELDPYGHDCRIALKGRLTKKDKEETVEWKFAEDVVVNADSRIQRVFNVVTDAPPTYFRAKTEGEKKQAVIIQQGKQEKKLLAEVKEAKREIIAIVQNTPPGQNVADHIERLDLLEEQEKDLTTSVARSYSTLADLNQAIATRDTAVARAVNLTFSAVPSLGVDKDAILSPSLYSMKKLDEDPFGDN